MVVRLVRAVAVCADPPRAASPAARGRRRPAAGRADLVRAAARAERAVVARRRRARTPTGASNPASEPVLAAQQFLLDDALAKLEDERPGVTDLYFVGFAPDGAQDVLPQGRRGGAAGDGRALGHARPLDRARQQSADAADDAVRDGHATCARR